jgi:hypothetical protein
MNATEEQTASKEMTDTKHAASCLASKQNDNWIKFTFKAT